MQGEDISSAHHNTSDPTDAGESTNAPLAGIGRWLGLLLFGVMLILPTPQGMWEAARARIELQRPSAVDQGPRDRHIEGVPPEALDRRRADDAAIAHSTRRMQFVAAVIVLVSVWWIFVALPIGATSLVPLLLFPALGVLPVGQVARSYADSAVFLFLGGFVLALAVERCGLHRRIALGIVARVGVSPSGVVWGFMLATGLISMWISNTATAMMMLPIGLAVVVFMKEVTPEQDQAQGRNFAAAVMMGIAYAASIGGMGTPIGTPPNIIFLGQYHKLFPNAQEVSFSRWMLFAVPLILVFLVVAWLLITRVTCRVPRGRVADVRPLVDRQRQSLGPLSTSEWRVALIFLATAFLWATRSIPTSTHSDWGWAARLEHRIGRVSAGVPWFRADSINDASIAIGAALLLFLIPGGKRGGSRERLMDWPTARRLPWDVLLLFGGGFALAEGMQEVGLDHWCSWELRRFGGYSPWLLVPATCLLVTFLSEIASNTATAQIMLPIMAQLSVAAGVSPLLLMVPATLAASCGFMLPVATPPNAIAFGSGYLRMGSMVRTGFVLNLAGAALITVATLLLVRPILGLDSQGE